MRANKRLTFAPRVHPIRPLRPTPCQLRLTLILFPGAFGLILHRQKLKLVVGRWVRLKSLYPKLAILRQPTEYFIAGGVSSAQLQRGYLYYPLKHSNSTLRTLITNLNSRR